MEPYNILTDPAQPQVGSKARIGRFLGPEGFIRKVQAVEWVDGVNYFRPQNTVFDHKAQPDKEGWDEVIICENHQQAGAFWLCWIEMPKMTAEAFLEGLYEIAESAVHRCKYIMKNGMNLHKNYATWAKILRLVDLNKLDASVTIGFFATLKGCAHEIEGYNDFLDRVIKHYSDNGDMPKEEAISLFDKWRTDGEPPLKSPFDIFGL